MKKTLFFLFLISLFAPWATWGQSTEHTLALYADETVINQKVPIPTTDCPTYWTKTEFVYPAEDLQEMQYRNITQITFYAAPVNLNLYNSSSFAIYMVEVPNATFSEFDTLPYGRSVSVYGNTSFITEDGVGRLTFTFGDGYEYQGGNLLIGCYNTSNGYYGPQWYYYGKEAPGASISDRLHKAYSSTYYYATFDNPVQQNFLPRITFTYTGSPHACPIPTNLSVEYNVDDATSTATATATWSGSASSYNIEVNGTVTNNVSSPYTFNVTAETHYTVRVRAACDNANSYWTQPVRFIPSSHTQIGWGTATDLNKSLPLNNTHNYSLTEQIYTARELDSTAATFYTIDFYKVGTGACERNIDIYMVNSSFNNYGNSNSHVRANQADLVYSGTVSFANDAWTSIELETPFEYDGIHDLAILVDDNTGSAGANDEKFLTYISGFPGQSSATPKRGVYHYSDDFNYNPDVQNISTWGYSDTSFTWVNKNQIRLLKGPAPACFKPVNITINADNVTATTATLSWEDLNGATTWKVKYATSIESLQNAVEQTVTGNPTYTLENLTPGYTQYYVSVQSVCNHGDPTDPDNQPVMSEWSRPISFHTPLCADEDKCLISCDLYDNGGQGWDEAAINIYDDASGIFLYSWTCGATGGDGGEDKSVAYLSGTDNLRVCLDRSIRFEWDNSYHVNVEEFPYVIYDLNNSVLFSGTGDDIHNITRSTDCVGSTCGSPTNFRVTSSGDGATVQWGGSSDVTYNLYLNGTLYAENVTSPYSLENLDLATTYQVQLEATCGSEPSKWSRVVRFTTDICRLEDRCTITYELNDETGEGMNWVAIWVYDDATNTLLARWGGNDWEYEYDEDRDGFFSMSGTLSVCTGTTLRFEWNDQPCYTCGWSFIIKDRNQEETVIDLNDLFSNNATYYVDCYETSCHKPSNYVVDYEGGTTATATWTMVDGISYNLRVNGTVINNVTSPYYLNDLDYATLYEVALQADCGNEVSQWSRKSFATVCCPQDEMCQISYELGHVNNSTSWYGTKIQVVDDLTGIVLDSWTMEGASGSSVEGTLSVCNGRPIRFEWVHGYAYDGNHTYTIMGSNGEIIQSGQGAFSESFSYTPNCINGVIEPYGWYAISAYTHDENQTQNYSLSLSNVNGLIPTETGVAYDLFRYNEATATWENQKTDNNGTGFTSLEAGRGYIYRRSEGVTLTFNGTTNEGGFTSSYSITKSSACPDDSLKGFNLIGNPYNHQIYKGVDFDNGNLAYLADGFYSLNLDGTWLARLNSDPINIGEGILVKVKSLINTTPITLTFSDSEAKSSGGGVPQPKGSADKGLQFTVSGGDHTDVAYAILDAQSDDSEGLPKIAHLTAEAPILSIRQGGTDYAIAHIDGTTQAFPLKFRASTNGEYTITASAVPVPSLEGSADRRGVCSSISYLHLVDHATGRDIDLLRQPTYTFKHAGSQASANRFTVRLSPDGESASDIFAYQNGDKIVVEGTGTLQVYDVLGRQLLTHEINSQFSIPNSQFPSTGVYILRLNGKSQKLVIK
ncbi:MAG: fibronectin type III domain-containing protein [Bacteroidales bacterium]|nr:fibronectin type III domain-containing protein [Bacteroidales bacterium]